MAVVGSLKILPELREKVDSELTQWVSLGCWMPIRRLGSFYTRLGAKIAVEFAQ